MNYELCKKLKEAGFFQIDGGYPDGSDRMFYYNNCIIPFRALKEIKTNMGWEINRREVATMIPTLSELIEACGDVWIKLIINRKKEAAILREGQGLVDDVVWYKSPEEAVANLWLTLNSKQP